MFRGHVRRSGSLRSIWHKRERKRRPLEALPLALTAPVRVRFTRQTPNEAEWLGGNPHDMIRCVVRLATDRGIVFHMTPSAAVRKLRLFYCACCRLRWELLPIAVREVVEVVERYADGRVNAQLLRAARRIAQDAERATRPVWTPGGYPPGAWDVTSTIGLAVAATEIHTQLHLMNVRDGSPVKDAEQLTLLRDIFENPFRPIALAGAWFTPTVVTLARVIRTQRAFDLMPVLGDALQDTGCDRADILGHCYEVGSHAVGCWLVDRLAAKLGE